MPYDTRRMDGESWANTPRPQTRLAVALAVVALACLRLCHVHLLWADEDYHLAAALNILHGKVMYRDFWYDKPPLNAIYYLLIGAHAGWPLRILDSFYVLAACFAAFSIARSWWGEKEGLVAAFLLAFYFTFYLPSAVIAFAADALMLLPHLAAIYCAFKKRPFLAGLCCVLAFLVNAKALFVLAVCGIWLLDFLPLLLLGFAVPLGAASLLFLVSGSWPGYYEQVWRWGLLYATGSPVTNPFATGFVRTADWLGFHGAIAAGSIFCILRSSRSDRFKLLSWIVVSFAAVCLGTRFAPHYFLQLLPALVIAASRGTVLAWSGYRKQTAVILGIALLVPLARFGPRYLMLAYDSFKGQRPHWSDVAMDLDSQNVARQIRAHSRSGDTLLVWGYRPDIYVYTRLTSDSIFWDSQPLTGVPADRHLHVRDAIYGGPAAANRAQLTKSHPTWLVDGLGPLNPRLAPNVFADLRPWLAHYRIVGRTSLCVIYHRLD
ncbi:MAG: hypothetical protein M3Y24_09595 [Acidobacteriota bacterium]|nr:hypothetical protein [Acidobacteriota bacterium]